MVDRLKATLQNRLLLELAVDVISARIARAPKPEWRRRVELELLLSEAEVLLGGNRP